MVREKSGNFISDYEWAPCVTCSLLFIMFQSKVEKIIGHAQFIDNNTVEVNGEMIKAKHILIATGGRPVLPTIPGGEHAITSDGFFELEDLPK